MIEKIELEECRRLEMLQKQLPRRRQECFHVFKIPMGIGTLQFGFQIIDKLPNLEFALG